MKCSSKDHNILNEIISNVNNFHKSSFSFELNNFLDTLHVKFRLGDITLSVKRDYEKKCFYVENYPNFEYIQINAITLFIS